MHCGGLPAIIAGKSAREEGAWVSGGGRGGDPGARSVVGHDWVASWHLRKAAAEVANVGRQQVGQVAVLHLGHVDARPLDCMRAGVLGGGRGGCSRRAGK